MTKVTKTAATQQSIGTLKRRRDGDGDEDGDRMIMTMTMTNVMTMMTTTVMMATAMIFDGGCIDGDSGNDGGGNTTIK